MPESPAARFAAACARGVLAYQWDPAAGRAVFYPRDLPGLEWRESGGRGAVYATTVVRPRGEEPHNVALIDLDEGFRMMSRVRGVAPEGVRIGMRVRVAFEAGVPVFEPEGAA
jgi:uncharacterized OB-fold protein